VTLLAVVLAIGVVILATRPGGPTTGPTSQATQTATAPAVDEPLYLTQYIAVNPGGAKPGAIIIDLHSDYQCPWCAKAELLYGQALADLAQTGDIEFRIHLRTIIGDNMLHNDSSERASRAATCADTIGAFWAYHSTIFNNQPEEGVGFTDAQLRVDFAQQAGISGANLTQFQACYDQGTTASFVAAMEQEAAQVGIVSTPTFYINGLPISFDLRATSAPSAEQLLAAIKNTLGQ
jgi:protein-disulfide isomerase